MSAPSDEREFADGFHAGYHHQISDHTPMWRDGFAAGCEYAQQHARERREDRALVQRNERTGSGQ